MAYSTDSDLPQASPPAAPRSQKLFWLSVAVLTLFCGTLVFSLFIPAFIDDILYLMQNARAGYDGWKSTIPFPQCGPNFVTDIPLSLLPGRWASWLVQLAITDEVSLRLSAVLILLAWIAYTAWFIRSCVLPAQPYLYIVAGIIALACIGTFPLLMTTSRPEGGMILAITLFVSLPFWVEKYPQPRWWIVLPVTAFFLLLTSWFFSTHAKSFTYSFLIVLSGLSVRKWNRAAGWLLAAAALLASAQVWQFWPHRFLCPDSIEIRQFWNGEALAPSLLLENPLLFVHKVLQDMIIGMTSVRDVLFPVRTYVIPHSDYWTITSFCMGILASLFILHLIWHYLKWFVKAAALMAMHARRSRDWGYPALPVALCLLLAAFIQWCIQSESKVYNFMLIWVTLVLGGLVTAFYHLRHTDYWDDRKEWVALRFDRLCRISLLTTYVLLMTCVPGTVTLLDQVSSNGDISMFYQWTDPWLMLSPLHYEQGREHILESAKSCHITPDQASRRVAVDMVTYLPLKATFQPMRIPFRFHDFDEPSTLFAFLHKEDSSGLVMLCKSLSERVRPFTTEHEGVCCMSREEIERQLR